MPKPKKEPSPSYDLISEDGSVSIRYSIEDIQKVVARMVGTNVTIGDTDYGYVIHAEFTPRRGIIGVSREEEYAKPKSAVFFKIKREPSDTGS